jgi:hypothetical protein
MRIAKLILSKILDQEIETLEFKPKHRQVTNRTI